jgi:pimeloyl-ACP methyl ester carboxylesterase
MPILQRNAVRLAYEEAGSKNPPLMLVHAWGGDRTWMRSLFDRLRARHRVVAVDLRGFGESDKPEQRYTIAAFADDLAWMASELRLQRPVLVGHSLGGAVVLEAAAHNPDLASGIVILEALVVAPPPLVASFRPMLDALRSGAFAPALTQMTQQLTGPHLDPRDRDAIIDKTVTNAPHVMISSLESSLAYDGISAAARCTVPALYVSSGPWYTDVARFKELCPTLVTAQLVGCGHFFPIEVPDQVHPIVARFIDTQVVGLLTTS